MWPPPWTGPRDSHGDVTVMDEATGTPLGTPPPQTSLRDGYRDASILDKTVDKTADKRCLYPGRCKWTAVRTPFQLWTRRRGGF